MKTLAVIAITLSLSLSALAQQAAPSATGKKPLTIDVVASEPRGGGAPQSLKWSPDGTKIAFTESSEGDGKQALFYFDPASGRRAVLVAADRLAELDRPPVNGKKDDRQSDNRERFGVAAYHWAPDSKSILFDRDGQLWLYDLATNKGLQVTTPASDASLDPKFSPDGAFVSFVRKHNLYIKPARGGAEIALTRDTNENLLNGEVDWLYSEELDVRSNYFWSPDSKQILFLQSNESKVPTYPVVDWVPRHPTLDTIKYPKVGDPNPTVRLAVVDLKGRVKWLPLDIGGEFYIPRFGWVRPGLAWAMALNRAQNRQDLYFIDVNTGRSRLVLREQDPFYVELVDAYRFLKSGDRFLWPSWRDGHMHLYLYSFDKQNPLAAEARLVKQLTEGEYEVDGVEGIDEQNGVVYFVANKDDARQSHLYSVKLDGSGLTRITPGGGTHKPSMSENTRYFVDSYSSLTQQPKMSICAVGGQCHEIWASHRYDEYALQTPQFVDFKAEDGTVLHGLLLMPANATAAASVPLVMSPYGGPHGQEVIDAFSAMSGFDQVMAQRGFAVLKVDNRGMGNRGRKFATATYKNLGEVETRDQLAVLNQALERFPQFDRNRLGFWGWSYGGSMTLALMTASDVFKVGVAVAPVTDWRNYDTAYTERYMGLLPEDAEAYERTSIEKRAANLKGNLMIVHGTSDDNVHMQNTVQFIHELINHGKQFCLQMYPQKTHSISGAKARAHLYTRILMQFENGLMKQQAAAGAK
ncbi:MAG TPA: S9 family peptidase [Clostridia bacterium]|nr:S9 family peptidase [Clostridia bacterium]